MLQQPIFLCITCLCVRRQEIGQMLLLRADAAAILLPLSPEKFCQISEHRCHTGRFLKNDFVPKTGQRQDSEIHIQRAVQHLAESLQKVLLLRPVSLQKGDRHHAERHEDAGKRLLHHIGII